MNCAAKRVAVLGLGEAGSRFAADLAAAGVDVCGYDPAPVPTPPGVVRYDDPTSAVDGADVVLALTAAADAVGALSPCLCSLRPGTIYADLSTSSARVKQELVAILAAGAAGVAFADVALMAVVPGNGLRTPALVSGPGAESYVAWLRPFGVDVQSIGLVPGDAATRKLLRSVFMKGLAAVVIEAMAAGEAAGQSEWLWDNIVSEITAAGAPLLSRLALGTGPHAVRRLHEMEACATMLVELGIDPVMTDATVESLHRVIANGLPPIPSES